MKQYLWSVLLLLSPWALGAQDIEDNTDSSGRVAIRLDAMAVGTANSQVPFWMRTNQFGSIPEYGASGSMIGAIVKDYSGNGLLDWGAGVEGRLNLGRRVNFRLIEAYAKVRLSIFQLKAGRTRDYIGIADAALSSGNFSVSGNALGIPKVELSIPDYWTVPFTRDIVALKGSLAYGILGKEKMNTDISLQSELQTYYHQKSFYGRIGKPGWKIKLYGGINHQVMWGGEKEMYGNQYELSGLKTLWYVTSGKAYGNDSIPRSKIGNHIGSIDQAIAYEFKPFTVTLYHQFFYEVGGLYHLNNVKDGLWGIRFTNNNQEDKKITWQNALIEFMASKSQGGELDAKVTPSGDEDYYNNYLYPLGWSYQEENLGNNFMTNKKYQRRELPSHDPEYFGNNRILLLHLAATARYYSWSITGKFSFSSNYGTYATSPMGNTTGGKRVIYDPPYFQRVNQCSGYLEASRPLKKGYSIGFVIAADYGDLLYNSVGGMLRFSKSW